jgi:thymidylate synthase
MEFDISETFPAVTIKKLMFKAMMGELLWFLSKGTNLEQLNHYSNKAPGSWNIWTNDARRYHGLPSKSPGDTDVEDANLGKLYGHQWRNFNGEVDQIKNLIKSLKKEPYARYHRVTAWNPCDITRKEMALPACHTDFQCYVTNSGKLNLHYNQRSADTYLGVCFNVASYAALVYILAKLTGLKPGKLTCTMVDVHIYVDHLPVIRKVLRNPCLELPTLVMPKFKTLEKLLEYTAKDFKLKNYKCYQGDASAPLSVGA